MGVVSPGACCCDGGGGCLCDVYGWYTYYPHTFDGGPGGRMVASPGLLDTQDEPYQAHGCITKSYGDDPFGHELKFEWFGWPGFQYGCTRVYSTDGDLVDTVYPMFGSKGTTVANRATAPLYALAYSIPQPTLDVDIEVEGNLVPPAVAGHYTFDDVNYAGGKKYYIYETDYPDPYPDKLTELVAVSLNRNDGFVLKSWTGNCAYYDANGNYLGMLPESLPEDPDDWITGDTIYVKCLKAVGTHTASAMTDMAALAGASMPPMEPVMIPGSGNLDANVAPPHARAVQSVHHGEEPVKESADEVASYLRQFNYRTSYWHAPWKNDLLDALEDEIFEDQIFFYNGHGGMYDPQTTGIVPNSPGTPSPVQYWITASDVAAISGTFLPYKLVILSSCKSAKVNKGEAWKNAFGAQAFIGWNDSVNSAVTWAYDTAFFECTLFSEPNERRELASEAHWYALQIAQQHVKWKAPAGPGEPEILGDCCIPPWWWQMEH